jgi:glycosyltransferase involved in cell wall biosynthesis
MQGRTYVVVAAYNEAQRIDATLRGLAHAFPGAPIWVADDGSSDGTAEIARRAGARVQRSERVIGKGGAVTPAARAALAQAAAEPGERAVFVLCDGDLGDSARELGALADAVLRGEGEIVVAAFARRQGGGMGVARGFARWAIRVSCGVETEAPISGQRALTTEALEAVLPLAHGYGMELGMTIDALRVGHRLLELELELSHRHSGRTLPGFAHRGAQLLDFLRAYLARR